MITLILISILLGLHRLSVCHAVTGIGNYRVYLTLLMPFLWHVSVKQKSTL